MIDEVKKFITEEKYNELFADGRNKILKSLIDSKEFISYLLDFWTSDVARVYFYDILDKIDLYDFLTEHISRYKHDPWKFTYHFIIMDIQFSSNKYYVVNDICVDGDINSIRYILAETGKVYKMKAAKFFQKVVSEMDIPIPEVAIHWLAEVFADKRKALLLEMQSDRYVLKTGNELEDFVKIYNTENPDVDGCSCMRGGQHASFYKNSVNCTAAWLEFNNKIVCRCVIYNKVWDTEGHIYRLAERQYANKDFLKELLITKLIKANLIDGYKKVGAGASDSTRFLLNDGSKMKNTDLTIDCILYSGDVISYQDSFKNYFPEKRIATNFEYYYSDLSTTAMRYNGRNYIKCPACGKIFDLEKGYKLDDDEYIYCSEECLKSGKRDFLDDGIQKVKSHLYLKYDPILKKRINFYNFNPNLPDSYRYNEKKYIGFYTIFNGCKIPSEKVIQQFDLKGNFIQEWDSVNSIKISLNFNQNSSSIEKCLSGQQKTAYKFVWKYKDAS